MAINTEDPRACYEDIAAHVGHQLAAVRYGGGVNVAIECETCGQVLLDADEPEESSDDE